MDSTHLVVQIYLRPDDNEFLPVENRRLKRTFSQEVFKSDLYSKIEIKNLGGELTNCLVVGIRQYVTCEPSFETQDESSNEPTVQVKPENIFVCESYFSTAFRYFRKLGTKKWSPLGPISAPAPEPPVYNFTFIKRQFPWQPERVYSNQTFIDEMIRTFDAKMSPMFANKTPNRAYFRETVQFDTLPPAAKDLDGEGESGTTGADDDLIELAKSSRFYEQVNISGELYKLGDYVYVRYQQLSANQPQRDEYKLPLIVRIDRLWSHKNAAPDQLAQYFIRGPVFLRSTDIPHEPNRLFYTNEVCFIVILCDFSKYQS